jgi:hypothetical protein
MIYVDPDGRLVALAEIFHDEFTDPEKADTRKNNEVKDVFEKTGGNQVVAKTTNNPSTPFL